MMFLNQPVSFLRLHTWFAVPCVPHSTCHGATGRGSAHSICVHKQAQGWMKAKLSLAYEKIIFKKGGVGKVMTNTDVKMISY